LCWWVLLFSAASAFACSGKVGLHGLLFYRRLDSERAEALRRHDDDLYLVKLRDRILCETSVFRILIVSVVRETARGTLVQE
jgi:hypothetical protein